MKRKTKQILSGILLPFMLLPLLASCAEEKEEKGEVGVADTYLAEPVELDLAENELLMDIIEVDGLLRATVGVTSDELAKQYGTNYGTPYQTEYRYYDMELKEDETKREPTPSFYQIAQSSDPSLGLTVGGEPFIPSNENSEEPSYGVRYRIYKDGEAISDVINPWGAGKYGRYTKYGACANVVMIEDTPYVWMDYTDYNYELYIKDHFVNSADIAPETTVINYGLMEIGGMPYALLCVMQEYITGEIDYFSTVDDGQAMLTPLTPKTAEFSIEGIEIEGKTTGAAFSDGTYGYFFCGSELWRTDGAASTCICDMVYVGVSGVSEIRAVRSLADGRILVVADGKLFELTASESTVPSERSIYTLGVMNGGYIPWVERMVSDFNAAGKDCRFVVKEYKNVTKLNLALVSKEVDVILTADQVALNNYIKQELLAPLDELVPEFFEEGVLIENIVDAARQNGVCYYLPREFHIRGQKVDSRLWEKASKAETLEEYCQFILENDPGYMKEWNKKTLVYNFIDTADDWIDWESNTCHFEDGTFESFLEFCNKAVNYDEWLAGSKETVYTENFSIGGLILPQEFCDMETAKEYLESGVGLLDGTADIVFPFPYRTHEGFAILADGLFAVVDKEDSREAAREFMKWHFLENVVGEILPDDPEADLADYAVKEVYDIPINQAECERLIGRNLKWNGEDKETRLPMEQRRYEDTWKIIRQADHFQNKHNAVFDVMVEEAYRYIAGTITAKQAAEYVQNRVSLYLAEQG